jgi:hypothetical protein
MHHRLSTMQKLIPMILAFLPSVALAINPSDTRYPRHSVTVDYLYEACSVVGDTAKGDIPYFDCESYVYGVLDAYLKMRESIPKANRACFPVDIEPWRVLEMANPKPGTYPRSETAGAFLIDYLRKRYPCT